MNIQTEITNDERIRILRELQKLKCFCGHTKRPGQTFCNRHYCALPPSMRSALYQKFGKGYEEAYVEARQYFEKQKQEVV